MSAPWEGGGGRRQGQGIIPPHPLTRRSIAPNKGSASGSVPRTFLASASGPSMCFGRLGGRIPPWGWRGQGIYLCGCESVLGSAFCRGRKDTPEKKLPRFLGGPPLYSLILDVGTRMHLHIKFISFCFCFNLTRLRYLMRAPCFPGHTRGDWVGILRILVWAFGDVSYKILLDCTLCLRKTGLDAPLTHPLTSPRRFPIEPRGA